VTALGGDVSVSPWYLSVGIFLGGEFCAAITKGTGGQQITLLRGRSEFFAQ